MPLIRKTPDSARGESPTLPDTLAALTQGSDDERWAAARAAADVPGGAAALGEALRQENNRRVREAMFTSLARIGSPESVEAVLPFLRSDDANLRTAALDTLRTVAHAAHPHLPHLLKDEDIDIRLLACEITRSLSAEEATRVLCDLLEDEPEPNVCAAAVDVLAEIGESEALPVLARCGDRFHATPFLAFSIKAAMDRIRSLSPHPRG
jgi:HEAT repeat protein